MYVHKKESDLRCPLEYATELFKGKWKARIICLLDKRGTLRYGEIKEATKGITDNVLAASLNDLEKDGIIERIQYNEIPVRVEYTATERGLSLVPVLHSICHWAVVSYGESILPDKDGCPYVE